MKQFNTIPGNQPPKTNHVGMWKKIKNIKKLLKKKDNTNSVLSSVVSGGSSLMSENQTPSGWWIKGLAPELQQRQKRLADNDLVNVSEIICSIPQTQMDKAVHVLDTTGSNMLHLACYHGSSLNSINYIFTNCSNDARIKLVNSQDKEGNIPLFVAAQCICRDNTSFEEGMKVIERLFTLCPNTIHHMNQDKETVMDLVHKYFCNIHTESMEYQRLYKLYTVLRGYCHQAYHLKKKKWERDGYKIPEKYDNSESSSETAPVTYLVSDVTQVSNTNATILFRN